MSSHRVKALPEDRLHELALSAMLRYEYCWELRKPGDALADRIISRMQERRETGK